MDFTGITLSYIDGKDGKYGVVVQIPSHVRVVGITHNVPSSSGGCDPLDCLESVSIVLKEA